MPQYRPSFIFWYKQIDKFRLKDKFSSSPWQAVFWPKIRWKWRGLQVSSLVSECVNKVNFLTATCDAKPSRLFSTFWGIFTPSDGLCDAQVKLRWQMVKVHHNFRTSGFLQQPHKRRTVKLLFHSWTDAYPGDENQPVSHLGKLELLSFVFYILHNSTVMQQKVSSSDRKLWSKTRLRPQTIWGALVLAPDCVFH